MARFLVTNGSNFQPLTYDEITRPLYEMAEAHRASQDAYDALSMQTESLRNYITDNPGDTKARTMYDNYVNRLQSLQDELWSTGYNTSTRRNLQLARNGFMSDINRIGKAIENRQARSAEYNKFKHEHPDMVMGEDPGLSGLDNYLDNDLYGTNWYQYSGLQFTEEVAKDALERSKEFFNNIAQNIDVTKDPRLKGYLITSIKTGVTSQQVSKAGDLVRAAVQNGNLDVKFNESSAEGVLANVLLSHLKASGANGNVSQSEFDRLVNRGIDGLSRAIGDETPKFLEDQVWKQNQDFINWKQKRIQERKWAKEDYDEMMAQQQDQENNRRRDFVIGHDTDEIHGENSDKANEITSKYSTGKDTVVMTKDDKAPTREYNNKVQAAKDVFSEDSRRDAYDIFHFDIGRNPNPGLWGTGVLNSDKDLLHGWFIGKDGNRHDIIYDPKVDYNSGKGAIVVVENGQRKGIEPAMTQLYRQYRTRYEEVLDHYMRHERDVYDLAKGLDPDSQYSDYRKLGVPENIGLDEFRDYAMRQPQNMLSGKVKRYRFADSDNQEVRQRYIDKFIDHVGIDNDGKFVMESRSDNRKRNDAYSGVYKYDKSTGDIDGKSIRNLNDILTYDKGKVNIKSLDVTLDSMTGEGSGNGGFIVTLNDNKTYFFSSSMFGGETESLFDKACSEYEYLLNNSASMSADKFSAAYDDIIYNLFAGLHDLPDAKHSGLESPTSK